MRAIFFSVSIFVLAIFLISSCKNETPQLPYMGNVEFINGDSVYHTVPDYKVIDQDSQEIRLSQFGNKIFIADFFFTSCPSICPKVTKQMLRIYDRYKDDDRVVLLSYTIDQRHDSVAVLNRYAKNLGVESIRWKFVTGEKDSIFQLADDYFVSAVVDPDAPGGFDHSGRIILLDKDRHVRGYCEGTDPESVTSFFNTIDQLLHEQYP